MASAVNGIQLEQIEAIEVAALFDDRPVAIEKHRGPHQAVALATRSIAARTRAGLNAGHAAVIDRALPKHTGAAPHRIGDHFGGNARVR